MKYWAWVVYTLVWDMFVWGGFTYLIYWHGASMLWYLAAAVMTMQGNAPWRDETDE